MLPRIIKVPLKTSFAFLCGFIGTLRDGLELLAQNKADVNAVVNFTIPTSGWGTDNTVPSHPNYIDIAVTSLLDTDIVEVNVAPESVNTARAANFTVTQSYAGKFRLRAEKIPTAAISAQYHIINTVAYSTGN